MLKSFCSFLGRLGWFGCVLICGVALSQAAGVVSAAPVEEVVVEEGPDAGQLRSLESVTDAELWLETWVPVGMSYEQAPEFFDAADEVFFESSEQLWVFAYRSAKTGRWIAWVAFDAEGDTVVHTAGIPLTD